MSEIHYEELDKATYHSVRNTVERVLAWTENSRSVRYMGLVEALSGLIRIEAETQAGHHE